MVSERKGARRRGAVQASIAEVPLSDPLESRLPGNDAIVPRPLADLIAAVPGARLVAGDGRVLVHGLTHDSRRVEPGALFVALPGRRHDGAAFVGEAVARGAVAVVSQCAVPTAPVPWVAVPAARPALADFATAWYGRPAERLRLIGVTGTDGKTTTAHLIGELLRAHGRTCGWYTTTDLRLGDAVAPNADERTTPEADRVQEVLAAMVRAGCDVAVLEASSHALAQDRLRGCAFDVAVFTNLSPEHLEFHGSLEAYLEAKARLFAMLDEPSGKPAPRYAVLNADDPASARLRAACSVPVVTYGLGAGADVWATDIEGRPGGTHLVVHSARGAWPLTTRFLGQHNVLNWLAAIAVAEREGVPAATIQAAARQIGPPEGRLQPVACGQPFAVYVDFAHTPRALEATLLAARTAGPGRVLLAFGHAGGRTAANRPALGATAARLADYFVITTDDAYPEDPAAIAEAIAAGARAAGARCGEHYTICLDRRAAIRDVLTRARPGDVVVLAGMGHERTLRAGPVPEPWSDAAVAAAVLAELGYGRTAG